jgi:hypothetical protein
MSLNSLRIAHPMQLCPITSKTPDKPFHGGNTGSIPVRDANLLSGCRLKIGGAPSS